MKQYGDNNIGPRSVGCTVKDCRYHSAENKCRASKIVVSNDHAQNMTETFCSTFENRADM